MKRTRIYCVGAETRREHLSWVTLFGNMLYGRHKYFTALHLCE